MISSDVSANKIFGASWKFTGIFKKSNAFVRLKWL